MFDRDINKKKENSVTEKMDAHTASQTQENQGSGAKEVFVYRKPSFLDRILWGVRDIGKLKAKGNIKGLIRILGCMGREHRHMREEAIRALCDIGTTAIEPLIMTLKSDSMYARQGAARVLGKIGGSQAVEPLIAALRSYMPYTRVSVVEALGELGDTRAVKPLVTALGDCAQLESVRKSAVRALCKIDDAITVEPLIAAIQDDNQEVRTEAIQALGEIGDMRAVEQLVAVLSGESPTDWEPISNALDRLDWKPDKDANGAAYWIGKKEWSKCVGIGPEAVKPLLAVLGTDFTSIRCGAAGALGQLGDTRAVNPLITVLVDDDESVRESAIMALGQIGDAKAVKPLVAIFEDQPDEVRSKITSALRQFDETEVAKAKQMEDSQKNRIKILMELKSMVEHSVLKSDFEALLRSCGYMESYAKGISLCACGWPVFQIFEDGSSDVIRALANCWRSEDLDYDFQLYCLNCGAYLKGIG